MNRRTSIINISAVVLAVFLLALAVRLASPNVIQAQTGAPAQPTTATPPTDQIIVKYKPTAHVGVLDFIPGAARLQMLNLVAGTNTGYVRPLTSDTHVFKLSSRMSMTNVQAIADRMLALPDIEYAEPDRIMQALTTPNDPNWANQWQYWETYSMNLPTGWDITLGMTNTVVGIIDTGYRPHADLSGRFIQGYDFISNASIANDGNLRDADPSDPGDWITAADAATAFFSGCFVSNSSWHGTHVAGTIGANNNNSLGVSGVNWYARIEPLRVLGKCGGYTSDIADAIRWGAGLSVSGVPANANPAKVMNMSLGGGGACDTTTQNAIYAANAVGAIIVVAAGNSNANASGYSPASCNGVITVGSTGRTGLRAYYSNYGALVDISAPGGDVSTGTANGILSTLNAGTTVPGADSYAYYQGTSMATPHVVGLVSLMATLSPTINFTRTEAILKATTRAFGAGNDCGTLGCGTGIIDAYAALSATLPISVANSGPTVLGRSTYLTTTINGSGLTYAWSFGDGTTGSGNTINHVYPLSGTYIAIVTATNSIYTRTTSTRVQVTNQAPTPFAGTNQTATVNALVTLNGSDSSDPDGHLPLSYGWRQTGGTTVILSNAAISQPTFTAPSSPTVLTFTLAVTDSTGLPAATTARTVVKVTNAPLGTITATNSSPTTLGNVTYLTATSSITAATYIWSFGDGNSGAGTSVSNLYPIAGNFTALVTATNGLVTQTGSTVVIITNLPPVAVVGASQSVSITAPVTLDGFSSYDPDGHTPLTYGWRQTGGTTVSLSNATLSQTTLTAPVTSGILTFTLTVTDAQGLVSATAARTTITVTDLPITTISAVNDSPTALGQTTTLTATSDGSNVTYTWRFGDGATSNGANVNHIYTLSGTYTTIVTATNSATTQGVTTTTFVTITNLAPIANAGTSQSVSAGTSSVMLDGSASTDPDGHTPLQYRWTQSGGTTVIMSNATISRPTFTAPGATTLLTFTLAVTDARGLGGAITARTTVTITDTPITIVTATNNSPTTLGQTTTLTATANGSGASFLWDFGDGAQASGATVGHVYGLTGNFTATVTATNTTSTLGVSDTVSITITNLAPIANAGVNQSVGVSAVVTLNGSASSDPDGHTPLIYGWTQTGGNPIILSSAIISRPTFTAPATPTVLTFTLMVTDARGLASNTSASTVVTVANLPITSVVARNNSPTTLGQITTLTATVAGNPGNVTYVWVFGDGSAAEYSQPASLASSVITHTYGLPGIYTAVVTATNASSTVTATTLVTITNIAPVANAGSNQNVVVSTVVTLNGSASSDADGHLPLLYGWVQTGGNNVTLSDATISRTTFTAPTLPTVLTFTLSVTDAQNLAGITAARTVVTVSNAPITSVVATNSSPTTLGQTTTLTVTSNGTNVTYAWRFGDNTTGTGAIVSHTYAISGTYRAIVTATNSTTTQGVTTTAYVTITNLRPVANAGVNQSATVSSVVALDGSASSDPDGHTPLAYRWTQSGGTAVVLSNAIISQPTFTAPSAPAVLTFTLAVTDARGLASATTSRTVVTITYTPVTIVTATNNSPTTLGQTTTLTATSDGTPGSITYAWRFGDGTQSSSSNTTVTHVYTLTGVFTAIVSATNSARTQVVTATTSVTITNLAPAANAGVYQTATVGSLVILNGSASSDPDGHTPLTYGWRLTGGTPVVLSNAIISKPTFTAPAAPSVLTFTLTVTDTRGLVGAASSQTVVTITDTPISVVTATNSSPTTLGRTTTLTATSNGSNAAYIWDFGDALAGTGAVVTHTYLVSGTYRASVTATNSASTQGMAATTSVTITNLAPVANAGTSQTATVGTLVTLNSSASSDPDNHLPLSYGWIQTDGGAVVLSSAIISRPTFTAPATPTLLTFMLMVTDAQGLIDATPASVIVTISDAPITSVVATNNSPTTLGQSTFLTVTTNGSNVTYAWRFGDNTQSSSANATISHTYALSGTYRAIITATNATSTQGVTATTWVTITNAAPVPDAGAYQTTTILSLVTLDGSASSDPDGHMPLAYGWTQTGGFTVTLNSPTLSRTTFIAPASPGVLTFTLVVTDAQGLPSSTTAIASTARTVVTITDVPITTISAVSDGPTILDQTTTLTATSNGSNVTYAWRFGDGTQSSGSSTTVTHVYTLTGVFTAIVSATNSASLQGVTATTSVTITNLAPVANAGVNQTATVGSLVALNGSASSDPDGHTPLVYGWRLTGGTPVVLSSAIISKPTFTAHATPSVLTFTLTVTDARGMVGAASSLTVITVTDTPINIVTATNNSPTTLGQSTLFTVTSNGSNATYAWSFGDNTQSSSTAATISHTYAVSETFAAIVTATNSATTQGATATTSVTITNLAPIANAGTNQTATVGTLVTLNGSASSDPDNHLPLSYGWIQTDGGAVVLSSAIISRPTFTAPATPTLLTFMLMVTDAQGLIDATPASVIVTISDAPITSVVATNNSPTTLGQSTFLTVTSNGSNVTYAWRFGDNTQSSSTNATISHTYALSGTYRAIVTATNATSTQDVTATTWVTITNAAPVPDAGAYQTATILNLVTLDGSASSDPDGHMPLAYGWTQTGGFTATLNTPTLSRTTFIAPASPSVLTFTLLVTDAQNLASLLHASTIVTVTDTPISSVIVTNSSPTTLGEMTTLTVTTDGSNPNHAWDFGDNATVLLRVGMLSAGTDVTVAHTYAQVGTYTATVTVTNSTSSQGIATTVVRVVPAPVICIPLSGITVTTEVTSTPPSPTLYTSQSLTASVTPLTASLPITYAWVVDGKETTLSPSMAYTSLITSTWLFFGQHHITTTAVNACSAVNVITRLDVLPVSIVYVPIVMK